MNESILLNKNLLPRLKDKRYQQKKNIIGYLYKLEELSKPEICRLTNLTMPTIGRIIEELIEEGWVVDKGYGTSIGGKRPHIYSLNPDAAYVLGVDIGRETLKIAIFNLKNEAMGDILDYPSNLENSSDDEVIQYIKEKIDESIEKLNIKKSKIKVAGFSLPGLIDKEGNSFTYLPYYRPNLKEILERVHEIPVFLDNDSNVNAMAESTFGSAKGVENALCISISECVGLGMILNSQLYTGGDGMAGEFGHIRISGLDKACPCGKNGCLEAVASGRALIKEAKKAIDKGQKTSINKEDVTLSNIIESARRDDLFAIELLQKAGEKIGEGISTLIHLFNPTKIVIGGEISEADELILLPIRQAMNKYSLAKMNNHVTLCRSTLGANAAIWGTLTMVLKNLYENTDNNFTLY